MIMRAPGGPTTGILALAMAVMAAAPACAQASFNTSVGAYSAQVTSMRDMPFRTVVRQQYDYSCGSAALATLLHHHYGRAVGEAVIFKAMYDHGDQAKIQKQGFSLLDMKRYLATQGLTANGFRETIEGLERSNEPAIALIQVGSYRHFVVIKGVRAGRVLVGDPAQGLKSYPISDFSKLWNGVVFRIESGQATGAFNRAEEWGHFVLPDAGQLDDAALASFTRELPPIYQISAFRDLGRGAP
jgi:predicted double-glycine peptidase